MYNLTNAQHMPQMELYDNLFHDHQKLNLFEKVFNSPEKTLQFFKQYENEYDEPQSRNGLTVDEATFWVDYYEDPNFKYEWNNGSL